MLRRLLALGLAASSLTMCAAAPVVSVNRHQPVPGALALGNTVVDIVSHGFLGNDKSVYPYSLPQMKVITRARHNFQTAGNHAQYVIYSASWDWKGQSNIYTAAGLPHPDRLMASSAPFITTVGWNEIPLTPVTLNPGIYFIGVLVQESGTYESLGSVAPNGTLFTKGDTFSDGPTDPFSTDNVWGVFSNRTNCSQIIADGPPAGRTNYILQSQDFTTTWAKIGSGNAAINANATMAPDATTTADGIAVTALANGQRGASQASSLTSVIGNSYTNSLYVKAGNQNQVKLAVTVVVPGTGAGAIFDLTTGAVVQQDAATAGTSAVYAGNGWWRVSVSTVATQVGGAGFAVMSASAGATLYTPAVLGNEIYVWGAQLETGSTPTDYIPTTTAPVTK